MERENRVGNNKKELAKLQYYMNYYVNRPSTRKKRRQKRRQKYFNSRSGEKTHFTFISQVETVKRVSKLLRN